MRKFLLPVVSVIALAAMASCGGNGNSAANSTLSDSTAVDSVDNGPRIQFDTAVFNFGRILQGEQVSTVFKFTNTGKSDLLINKVETSCGCTVPEYNREPVAPGNQGTIRVRFDSDGKSGTQYKTIQVKSNCADPIFDLVITGEVEVR